MSGMHKVTPEKVSQLRIFSTLKVFSYVQSLCIDKHNSLDAIAHSDEFLGITFSRNPLLKT